METIAKLFQNGRSQAVRLPKEFRFSGEMVKISRQGEKVILEPIEKTKWPRGFWNKFTPDSEFGTPEPLPTKEMNLD